MEPDRWDYEGDAAMTEHWRRVVPALSVEVADELTGIANDRARAAAVRQRYVLELKHVTRRGGRAGHIASGLTRLADWSPLTVEERSLSRPGSPFALVRGIPSALAADAHDVADDGLDFALMVSVAPGFLPKGPLFLDGVPLVIVRRRLLGPLPGNADLLWPPQPAVPGLP